MKYYTSKFDDYFDIVEKDTDMRIVLRTSKERATNICKNLNKGAGFNGFTPDFFASNKGHEMEEIQ